MKRLQDWLTPFLTKLRYEKIAGLANAFPYKAPL